MRLVASLLVPLSLGLSTPVFAQSLEDLDRAVAERPDDPAAYDAFAKEAFRAKRWEEAIRRLKVGVARLADYSEGYYKLAYAFRQKREWADAADYYRRYSALNPTKSDPWFGLAASLQGLGATAQAIAAYEKYVAMESAPDKQRFVEQARAELARLRSQPATALGAGVPAAVASSAVAPSSSTPASPPAEAPPATPAALAPGAVSSTTARPAAASPEAIAEAASLRATGDEQRQAGRLDEAIATFQKAVQLQPSNAELWNELGNVLFARKRFDEAQQGFRRATELDPTFALAFYNLAHSLRKSGQKSEAVTAYRSYIQLRPDDPDPYYGLGQTLKALGDGKGAVEALRKYVEMETRPDEQRWVDKARQDLAELSAAPAAGAR
jgi:tetratricopeptide (TPR) repeat protein